MSFKGTIESAFRALDLSLPEEMPGDVRDVEVRIVEGDVLAEDGGGALGRCCARLNIWRDAEGRVLLERAAEVWIEVPLWLVGGCVTAKDKAEGKRVLTEVLLHEAAHAWTSMSGLVRHGHGPRWAARCRKLGIEAREAVSAEEIAERLGL